MITLFKAHDIQSTEQWKVFEYEEARAIREWVGYGFCGIRCLMVVDGRLYDNMIDSNYSTEWVDQYNKEMDAIFKSQELAKDGQAWEGEFTGIIND